jgi:hypothetical protein
MENYIKLFDYDVTKADKEILNMLNEMKNGLEGKTSTLAMIPSYTGF